MTMIHCGCANVIPIYLPLMSNVNCISYLICGPIATHSQTSNDVYMSCVEAILDVVWFIFVAACNYIRNANPNKYVIFRIWISFEHLIWTCKNEQWSCMFHHFVPTILLADRENTKWIIFFRRMKESKNARANLNILLIHTATVV